MSDIFNKAKDLAKALNEDEQVVAYREATKKINENSEAKKLVEEFRKIQFKAYTEQIQTGMVSPQTSLEMQKFGETMNLNEEVSNYISAEASFADTWDKILKLLNEAIGVNIIAPSQE